MKLIKSNKPILLLSLFISFSYCSNLLSQTLGTVTFDQNLTSSGYVLYPPSTNSDVYLVDNCGRKINEWTSTYDLANSAYLDTSGNLFATYKEGLTAFIDGGGAFDRVIKQDWNGSILWNYGWPESESRPHHDFIPLPNGNVILLMWERKSMAECIAAGRNPATMSDTVIWTEKLIEIEPTGLTTGNIVWEWDMFDHLIQDFDNGQSNFGVISDHPELFNINAIGTGNNGTKDDWLHANSIQYIEEFDQIVISLRKINEAIIIDHSTTTAEAASHAGGTYGKGGDILYRIGNPVNYDLGTSTDKLLFRQHDCVVFPSGGNYYMSIFNNGNDRPTQYSSVDIIQLPMNPDGSYVYNTGSIFAPSNYTYSYTDATPANWFAQRVSGAQVLENGNIIICDGPKGYFFEIDTASNTKVWEYYSPIDANGSNNDGTDPSTLQNSVFKVRRYAESFQGFVGKTITPGDYVELNSLNSCNLSIDEEEISSFSISPNPAKETIHISGLNYGQRYEILELSGKIIQSGELQNGTINIEQINPGIYLIKINKSLERFVKY